MVRVSWGEWNPIHNAIFYTGFLNGAGGEPGSYSKVWNPMYDGMGPGYKDYRGPREWDYTRLHFMEVVSEIGSLD
jgi:hypothetical protein